MYNITFRIVFLSNGSWYLKCFSGETCDSNLKAQFVVSGDGHHFKSSFFCHTAQGLGDLLPRIEPRPCAVKALNPNH